MVRARVFKLEQSAVRFANHLEITASSHFLLISCSQFISLDTYQLRHSDRSNSLATEHLLPFPPLCKPISFAKFHSRPQARSHWHGTHFAKRFNASRLNGSMPTTLFASWGFGASGRDSTCSMYSTAMTKGFGWEESCGLVLSRRSRVQVSRMTLGVGCDCGLNCPWKERTAVRC